jgi:hypothetical protein
LFLRAGFVIGRRATFRELGNAIAERDRKMAELRASLNRDIRELRATLNRLQRLNMAMREEPLPGVH